MDMFKIDFKDRSLGVGLHLGGKEKRQRGKTTLHFLALVIK